MIWLEQRMYVPHTAFPLSDSGQLEYLSVGNLFVALVASQTKLTSLRGRGKGDWIVRKGGWW